VVYCPGRPAGRVEFKTSLQTVMQLVVAFGLGLQRVCVTCCMTNGKKNDCVSLGGLAPSQESVVMWVSLKWRAA